MAARPRTAKEQDAEDKTLVAYRLALVEVAVKDLSTKFDKQDVIKRPDLLELRDTIVGRITEIRADLQKQIDAKADKDQVDDLRSLVRAIGGIFATVIAGLVIYYLTNKR